MRDPAPRARVVIADDSPDVRELLGHVLALDGRFEVVGTAGDGAEAVAVVAGEQPDAVVLDLAMPVMGGLEALDEIVTLAPAARVVVLSALDASRAAETAMARGAHAYLEKAASFTDLANVLHSLCSSRRGIGVPATEVPYPEVANAPRQVAAHPSPPDDLASAGDRDGGHTMRMARWFGLVFAALQFALYAPPEGVDVPFPRLTAAAVVVAVLLLTNLVDRRFMARPGASPPRLLVLAEVVVDSAVTLGVVWLFTFDGTSALWALLIIPVLEGAVRAQLRGALAVWGLVAVGYVLREWWGASTYPGHRLMVDSLTYRLGIILLVGFTTGHLAKSFVLQTVRHDHARADAERRAELLRIVAGAGRAMALLDADRLLDEVADAAVSLGFEGVEICVYDEGDRMWFGTRQRGMPESYGVDPRPIGDGIAGAVRARRETLLVDDYSSWESGVAECRRAGFRATVGTPIWSGGDIAAALIVGTRKDITVSRSEVECLELLAAHAGVGLTNVRLLERMRHQAMHDALTGLPNQALFEDRVVQAVAQSGRSGERVAVVFLDLDRFKKVNDSLGHDFGNELLKQVAGRLIGAVRRSDTVARMGGDEFTLLLRGIDDEGDIAAAATKLCEAFREPFMVARHELFMTPSIGISLYPDDGLRYESLLKHADIAMYRAKARGGNTFELYATRGRDAAYPRLALEADLHAAIDNGELSVVYQPVRHLGARRVVAVEALVRWHHPSLGPVLPDEFVPLAEEAGLIAAVDSFVLREACRQVHTWRRDGVGPLRVAVNISGRHLQHPRMGEAVRAALTDSGLPAGQLELEVTESVAVAEVGDTRESLEALRQLGITVAIDDFGTGYSVLSRLRQFPVDTLKIDRSFVHEIVRADDEAPIVAATIAMAHSLGLVVVAEGVETEDQLAYLERHGCDLAQGFLIGRPVAAADIPGMVRVHTA